ncbi:MAG: AmpG family muropeptide MFS transporter [Xanthomonadaceae bacterium]|nr:AmpG family muropeptide MFS transporter [Xanthomonadaceae bacterium]
MGFSAGAPLFLIGSTLQAWMSDEKVDLSLISLFSLVGLPYTLKFLWAPVMDRFVPQFLGRRRGWLVMIQSLLFMAMIGLSRTHPSIDPMSVAVWALLIAFLSASQDIVIDAYRRESLKDEELGIGVSLYIYGYRISKIFTEAFALILAERIPWNTVFIIMTFSMVVGLATTFFANEPKVEATPPKTLRETVVDPFVDLFQRKGVKEAFLVLSFILLYKLGDNMGLANITYYFLSVVGFTKTELATIVKTLGLGATLVGAFLGGVGVIKFGLYRSLWFFGILQIISTFSLSLLLLTGPNPWALGIIIIAENLCTQMASSAFAAFLGSMTNKKFTATQYALFSSLMGVPRVLAAAPTGWIVQQVGWFSFYVICTLIAFPGLFLLTKIKPWIIQKGD